MERQKLAEYDHLNSDLTVPNLRPISEILKELGL